MSSPNISMCPYIGVESGTQLEPELSRLIGSARLSDEGIMSGSPPLSWVLWVAWDLCSSGADVFSCDFGIGRSALGVRRFLASSFTGTSVIPHLGHCPGASITTSECIGQVYFCEGISEAIALPAKIAAIIVKSNLFILLS